MESCDFAYYKKTTSGSGKMLEVALAVLGAAAAGKSTFVYCALDLKKPPTSPISSKKVSLEGNISIVRLLELNLKDIEVTADQSLHWPKNLGDQVTPEIDGVLALYDVMNQDSVSQIPDVLSECLLVNTLPLLLWNVWKM